MNQNDARNLIVALNNIQQYVPPILMAALISNPILIEAQTIANAPPDNVKQFMRNKDGADNRNPDGA